MKCLAKSNRRFTFKSRFVSGAWSLQNPSQSIPAQASLRLANNKIKDNQTNKNIMITFSDQ
jgi:hypothetical protein